MSTYEQPCYLGSIFGPPIFETSHLHICANLCRPQIEMPTSSGGVFQVQAARASLSTRSRGGGEVCPSRKSPQNLSQSPTIAPAM